MKTCCGMVLFVSLILTVPVKAVPYLDVTNANQTVDYSVSNLTIGGLSTDLIGQLRWTNSLNGANGLLAAASNWSFSSLLAVGTNVVTVSGQGGTLAISTNAADQGSATAYSDGWATGDDGGFGFGPWRLATTVADPNQNGHFVATDTNYAALDVPAWGLYANLNNTAEAFRPLDSPLATNQVLAVSFENGLVAAGGSCGIELLNSATQSLFTFYLSGGESFYRLGSTVTEVAMTTNGIGLEFRPSGTTNYSITLAPQGAVQRVYNGTLTPQADSQVALFRVWNYRAGEFSIRDVFINHLKVTTETMEAGSPVSDSVTLVRSNAPPAGTTVSGTISTPTTWALTGSPYKVVGSITISPSGCLTLEPGVTLQFGQYKMLTVQGCLQAMGTAEAPIQFVGSTPNADWWWGVDIQGTGAMTAAHCEFAHAGHFNGVGGIRKQGTGPLVVTDSRFHHIWTVGLTVYPGSSDLILARNSFSNNTTGVKAMAGANFNTPDSWFTYNTYGIYMHPNVGYVDTNSVFSGNTYPIYVESGTITRPVTWAVPSNNALYVQATTIATNGWLTVAPGTVLKFGQYQYLNVNGGLDAMGTPSAPIYFTDYRDDAVGGDTDRVVASPAPGWWSGLSCYGASLVRLAYSEVRYAGYNGGRGIYKTGSGRLGLSDAVVERTQGDGLVIDNATGPLSFDRCVFRLNNKGVRVANQSVEFGFINASILSNTTFGIENAGPATVDARGTWWGAVSGPYHVTANPSGQGNKVSDGVLFNPWRTNDQPLVALADLVVPAVAGPAAGTFGQPVDVTWTVRNTGELPTTVNWRDRVYLSSSSNSIAGATAMATFSNMVMLAVGQTYTNTSSAVLPLSTNSVPGDFFIVVKADTLNDVFEGDENNNLGSAPITLTRPPLPDLAVAGITAPASATAGATVDLLWILTNHTVTAAAGSWRHKVYLSTDVAPGGDLYLGESVFTGPLAGHASAVCTQRVTLPVSGPVGAMYFLVETDSRGDVVEEIETNNTTVATMPTAVDAQLTLSPSAASVLESAVNPNVAVTVTRNGSTTGALVVALGSSDITELVVPATATILAGQASATFQATAQPDGVFDADAMVSLTASAGHYLGATTTITVLNAEAPQLALSLDAAHVLEGAATTGRLYRPPGMTSVVAIALGNSAPAQLMVPATVLFDLNQSMTTFEVRAVDDNLVERTNVYTLSAGAAGYGSASTNIVVYDNDVPGVQIQLPVGSVSEADGAFSGTVTRDRTSTQPLTLALTSSDATAARVPATVVLPAMQTSVIFGVTAVNDDLVDGPQTTQISGAILETASGQPIADLAPVTLGVTDDDGPTLRLRLAATVVGEGLDPATTATVLRNTATNTSLVVSLASSQGLEATVPASVTIPAGTNAATFSVVTPADGTNDGSKAVMLTASASGFTPGSAQLTVTDADLPDLVVRYLTVPPGAYTEEPMSVSFQIANQGRAATATGFTVQVFRSADMVAGDDTLIRQLSISDAIGAGQVLVQTLQLTAPRTVGDSWLVVSVDSRGQVEELREDNNTAVSTDPTYVVAAYTAQVETAVTLAPINTPVPMTGMAYVVGSGQPASNKVVSVHVVVRGTRRTLSVLTDGAGGFTTTFQPLPNEGGDYEISAGHPGEIAPVPQDSFSLFGLTVRPVNEIRIAEGGSTNSLTIVTNLGATALSGLSVTVITSPPLVTVTAELSTNELAGDSMATLGYSVAAGAGSSPGGLARVRISAAEGFSFDLDLPIRVDALYPRLATDPAQLAAGMTRGRQTVVTFTLTNAGGVASGPLTILTPAAPWLSVASGADLSSLAAGGRAEVNLLLTPPVDLDLGPYGGSLVIRATNASVTVPFSFLCQSTAQGDLRISAVDEFTYYADGAPNVSNAAVTLTDPITDALILVTNTGPSGVVLIRNLTEAQYRVEVTAPDHGSFRHTMPVVAARTNTLTAFLPRHAVRYYWTVEPILIEDRTRIIIETVFETFVPMPVVTIEPAVIDLTQMVGNEMQVDVKITNHGLVAAENTRLNFGDFAGFTFAPLITDVGRLGAQQSMTIPVVIRRDPAPARKKNVVKGLLCTMGHYAALWELICGEENKEYGAEGLVSYAIDNCGAGVGFGGTGSQGSSSSGYMSGSQSGNPVITPPSSGGVSSNACDPCHIKKGAAALTCVVKGFPPIAFAYTFYGDCRNMVAPGSGWMDYAGCALGTFSAFGKLSGVSALFDIYTCKKSIEDACKEPAAASTRFSRLISKTGAPPASDLASEQKLDVQIERLGQLLSPLTNFYGRLEWLACTNDALWTNWYHHLNPAIDAAGDAGEKISTTERAQLLNVPLWDPLTTNDAISFIERWNRTFTYYDQGIFSVADVPPGGNLDFIEWSTWKQTAAEAENATLAVLAEGYSGVSEAVQQAYGDLMAELAGDSGGTCAKVRLQMEQEAVIARDAFRATLEIENNTYEPLDQVQISIMVTAPTGADATDLFSIRPPVLTGLTAVDGTGVVGAQATGSARWTLVPTADAAPTNATTYFVSGLLQYRQDGILISVPLAPSLITVYPSPRLTLRYFHQRDVYADDPFTVAIEPSLPYSLAVMIQNQGCGVARNMRITSAQPQIIENEKGLLVDFTILATEVGDQPLQPSLTAAFGDIMPGALKVGRWLLQSSLQGLFTSYSASFEHLDGLGDQKLSLIDSVSIHEMIRLVQADQGFEDGQPDFLVNDVVDIRDYPDTLWLSSGTNLPVLVVTNATLDAPVSSGHLTVEVTVERPAGWVYVRIPDPGDARYILLRALRPEASELPSNNVWRTDRTFVGSGKRPVTENVLHLLDYRATGGSVTYRLDYEDRSVPPDTTAPTSGVAALAADSPEIFAVSWSGLDEPGGSGLAGFDIYVSDNGGAYSRWVEGSGPGGAVFLGTPDHVYRFYSVAYDQAGNREEPPAVPDATTRVSVVNAPPMLAALPNDAVNEGDLFAGTASAVDTDTPPQTVTFSLPVRPSGATIGAANGQIRWQTGELNGPGAYLFQVTATDNGIPARSTSMSFTVTVHEVNTAPNLATLDPVSVDAGELMSVTPIAWDADVPAQTLTYSLVTAPAGAHIQPGDGTITWTPSAANAGHTYDVAVRVVDDGPGTLGATQSFRILVPGRLKLGVGSAVVQAGEEGDIPLHALAGAGIARIQATVMAPADLLSNWSLWSFGPHVGSASLVPLAGDMLKLNLDMIEGQSLAAGERLAWMRFQSSPQAESVFIPVELSGIAAWQLDGAAAAAPEAIPGRVVLINENSLLDLHGTGGALLVDVYGKPGVTYWFEGSSGLSSGWQSIWSGQLTNGAQTIGPLSGGDRLQLYRARE